MTARATIDRLMISIHALREESDACQEFHGFTSLVISIHALREESDQGGAAAGKPVTDFNPRPPRGERLVFSRAARSLAVFQSTPSARRATPARPAESHDQRISIHALREESDLLRPQPPRLRRNFNPRPPRGERQLLSAVLLQR